MNTNITADNAKTLTTRALVIAKALLQDIYVEMSNRFLRHGWASGPEAYNTEKFQIAETLEVINKELHIRYAREQAIQQAHEAVAAVVEAA